MSHKSQSEYAWSIVAPVNDGRADAAFVNGSIEGLVTSWTIVYTEMGAGDQSTDVFDVMI